MYSNKESFVFFETCSAKVYALKINHVAKINS